MTLSTNAERWRLESLDSAGLEQHQLARFNALVEQILPTNRFYAQKLAGIEFPLKSLDEFSRLPFTYKEALLSSRQAGDLANNLTFPAERYVRLHQTSGTRGRP